MTMFRWFSILFCILVPWKKVASAGEGLINIAEGEEYERKRQIRGLINRVGNRIILRSKNSLKPVGNWLSYANNN